MHATEAAYAAFVQQPDATDFCCREAPQGAGG